MDEKASSESSENPSKDFNKLDLSQLQGFSFGTQWTQDKSAPASSRPGDSHRTGERPPRRGGGGGGGDMRRDRRNFRKPAGEPGDTAAPAPDTGGAPAEGQPRPRRDDRPPRREPREGGQQHGERAHRGEHDPRGPRRDDRRDFRGPRRPGQGGDYRGPHREGGYEQREHTGPYFSPFYNVIFYPEDTGFAALVKAIRSSCRTYELFEIARVVIGKNDRFVATIQRKQPGAPQTKGTRPPHPRQPAAEAAEPAEKPAAPAKPPLFAISVPDGLAFENEETAIAHVLGKHLDRFFEAAEVEVEPPKGNYQIVNKCGVTGELLAPPNYHLYNQIVQQHQATRLPRMNMDAFRSRIETVRDPEVVKQWLEKMRKTTRYTWKFTPPPEGAQPLAFDSFDEARAYLLATVRDKVVRTAETARVHGKLLENLPQGEIRRAIESTLERQRRFPLDTANALRGRLRREGFTIFKKGSKGISYVCAVKRKFRVPGQTFADSIDALIAFIEANPMVKASELPAKFLGIQQPEAPPAPAPAAETPAPAPAETTPAEAAPTEEAPVDATPAEATEAAPAEETAPTAAESAEPQPDAAPTTATESAPVEAAPAETSGEPAPAASEPAPDGEAGKVAPAAEPAPAPGQTQPTQPIAPATSGSVPPFVTVSTPLSAEDQARLHRLTGDLRWLVSEGYVTEYINGSLFTYPPMSEARKKEVESEDHDDVPTAETQPASGQPAESPPEPEQPISESEQPVSDPEQPVSEPEMELPAPDEAPAEPEAVPESEVVPATETIVEQQPGEPSDEPKA